jgi:hypothetical protein
MAPRHRERPDIHQPLDAVRAQERQKVFLRARGVSDGVNGGHDE